METSYVPPEVMRQYAQSDQGDDQADTEPSPDQSNPNTDPQSASDAGSDPSGQSDPASQANQTALPPDVDGSEEETKPQPDESLGIKEQLKMLSPIAVLRSIGEQATSPPSQEEQQAQQAEAMRVEQQISRAQQDWQDRQLKRDQEGEQTKQEIEAIKTQAASFKHLESGSVLNQPVTSGAKVNIELFSRALKDAQKDEARHKKQLTVPKGIRKGPRDPSQMMDEESGYQKMTELTVGE